MINIDINQQRKPIESVWKPKNSDRYMFYYAESKDPVPWKGDYVLGGIWMNERHAHKEKAKLEEIMDSGSLPGGKFPECMGEERMGDFLNALLESGVSIHYTHRNNLYYAVTDIIDSILDEKAESGLYGENVNNIKNQLYLFSQDKEAELSSIFLKYNYPEIKTSYIHSFYQELLNLFASYPAISRESQVLESVISKAQARRDYRVFVENGYRVLHKAPIDISTRSIYLYKTSKHIWDKNVFFRKSILDITVYDGKNRIAPFCFSNTEDEFCLRISKVLTDILRELFMHINQGEYMAYMNKEKELTEKERENFMLLVKLMAKTRKRNKELVYTVASMQEQNTMDKYFVAMLGREYIVLHRNIR